jgi:hypothetical protein
MIGNSSVRVKKAGHESRGCPRTFRKGFDTKFLLVFQQERSFFPGSISVGGGLPVMLFKKKKWRR